VKASPLTALRRAQLIFPRVCRNSANFEETVDLAGVETCQRFAHWAGQEKKDARKTGWPWSVVLSQPGRVLPDRPFLRAHRCSEFYQKFSCRKNLVTKSASQNLAAWTSAREVLGGKGWKCLFLPRYLKSQAAGRAPTA